MENEICIDCQWNDYPLCMGTIETNGDFVKIDNLRPGFTCGQKDSDVINNLSMTPRIELLEIKNMHLNADIDKLKLDVLHLSSEIEKIKLK